MVTPESAAGLAASPTSCAKTVCVRSSHSATTGNVFLTGTYQLNSAILSPMEISPKLPRIAAIVAFVMAGFVALGALAGPIVLLPLALIPLFAGLGILRKRVWSAYGYAVFTLAQVALVPLILFRLARSNTTLAGMVASTALSLLIAALFLLAGRSLANAESPRGAA